MAIPSQDVTDVRARLMQEELDEYRKALAAGDVVRVADALSDLMYVVLGTYVSHGLHGKAEALFDEIHRSNMSKLDEHGRPIHRSDGKVRQLESIGVLEMVPYSYPIHAKSVSCKEDGRRSSYRRYRAWN